MNKKDAIIILAGGITKEGFLPDMAKPRINRGYELYGAGISKNVILSGRWSFMSDYVPPTTEARIMKDHIVSLGAEGKDIFLEERSTDTIGNAYFCKKILTSNNWHDVVVVTSDFHLNRTKYVFDKVLGKDIFSVLYLPVPSGLNNDKHKERELHEGRVFEYTRKWMSNIEDGNDRQVETFLYKDHPGYANNPTITKQELLDVVGRIKD